MTPETPIISHRIPASIDLSALAMREMEAFAVDCGEPAYRGRQLYRWVYFKGAVVFDEMSDLPARFREALGKRATLSRIEQTNLQTAKDGTVKVLFRLRSGRHIEVVLIPDIDAVGAARRLTVCVSSQVGCAMGCTFCATGLMGFKQNLTAGEIVEQVRMMNALALERFDRPVTNIVFMGMGEPLLNYDSVVLSTKILSDPDLFGMSPRRITISTVGLARMIRRLADDNTGVNLAISLHAPDDAKRSTIMPVNRGARTDLRALREAVIYYTRAAGRRVTYEYCMFHGFNDGPTDAERLAAVVGWAPSKVNLIMYNPVAGSGFERTSEDRLNDFLRILVDRNVSVTVRRSRGSDIDAACGQLATLETQE